MLFSIDFINIYNESLINLILIFDSNSFIIVLSSNNSSFLLFDEENIESASINNSLKNMILLVNIIFSKKAKITHL